MEFGILGYVCDLSLVRRRIEVVKDSSTERRYNSQPSSTILERSISVCGLTETLLALKTSSRFLVQYLIIIIVKQ